jgi:hypothetical protein
MVDSILQRKRRRKSAARKPNGGKKKKLAKRHVESLDMPIMNDALVETGPVRAHLDPAKTSITTGVVTRDAVVRLYQLVVHLVLLETMMKLYAKETAKETGGDGTRTKGIG